nr:hypothetical protein [Candidatus Sigynarchaeota archaeon]
MSLRLIPLQNPWTPSDYPIDWPLVASIAVVAGLVGVLVAAVTASRGKLRRRRI